MVLPTDLKNLLIAYERRILALEELTQQLKEKLNEAQRPARQTSQKGASKKRTSTKSSEEE